MSKNPLNYLSFILLLGICQAIASLPAPLTEEKPDPAFQRQSLDGVWKAAWFDGQRGCYQKGIDTPEADLSCYIDAQVPGEIHLDLIREGIIKNPAVEANCLSARWVEECIWTYRREFEAAPEAINARSWLVFNELAYAADIMLNGEKIATHANFFHPCRIETTGKLKAGKNLLTVHLDGGLFAVTDKPYAGYGLSLDSKLHKRHWLRSPQCQFAWDWSPRLINVGIGKSVRLEWTAAAARLDRFVPLVKLDAGLKKGKVTARVFVEKLVSGETECTLTASIPALQAKVSKILKLKAGGNLCEVEMEVAGFDLWWPRGYGAQPLYGIEVEVKSGSETLGTKHARIGFRSVEFNQRAHPVKGNYFNIEVNGTKIFAKGANFVPADFIYARIDKARYSKLVELAEEENFNMLRVWGGGLYESDDFYTLCDERGFLVWQEFCFSCTRYPGNDPEFVQSVEKEAIYQARRLAPHPSLIAWCGNNEIQQHQTSKGANRNGIVLPDYGIFHLVLPRIIAEEDPGRYYQPSSPYSPDITHPNTDDSGDQHPWGIGFSNNDFRGYRKMTCRFPCEGGILGPTSLPTMLACLPEGQRKHNSFAWTVQDNSIAPAAWVSPHVDNITQLWLGKDIASLSIEDYVYWGGILQGEGLKEYCENFRRRMFDSAAAIFWMYNDCWPTVRSWTTVDYYLRRTPSFHFVRRAMNPVHVVIAEDDGVCTVYGVNDTQGEISGRLRYGIFTLAGKYLKDVECDASLPANSSTPLVSFPSTEWTTRDQTLLFASLAGGDGRLLSRNRLCDKLFKEMKWSAPKVDVSLVDGQAVFRSDVFALDVCIDLDGEEKLADNYFDLWPGVSYSIPWTQKTPPTIKGIGNIK